MPKPEKQHAGNPGPRVFVITLNWNNASDTIECVDSLKHADIAACDIIVVDNGSRDGSAETVRHAHPDVSLLEMSRNLGFAEGNNVGIQHALEKGADFVLLLNNDTIVDPGLIPAFLDAWQNLPSPGFLGARIYYHGDRDRIWLGMPHWNTATFQFDFEGFDEVDDGRFGSEPTEVSYACGCALFVGANVIRDIGPMDPRFFCYFEEVDWCFRGREKGFSSHVVPGAKVWHKVSVSSGGKASPAIRYYRTRNALLFARKHFPLGTRLAIFHHSANNALGHMGWKEDHPGDMLKRVYWNLLTFKRHPLIKAWRWGLRDYLLGRFGPCPEALNTDWQNY
jgi:GT2 family glycosyltransferase